MFVFPFQIPVLRIIVISVRGIIFFLKKIIFQVRVVLFFRWGKRRKSRGDGYLPLLLLFSLLFCNGAWLSYKEDLFSCFGVWDVFVDMCFVIRAVTELRKGHLLFIIYLAMLGNESSCFRLEWGAVPCDHQIIEYIRGCSLATPYWRPPMSREFRVDSKVWRESHDVDRN